MTVRRPARLKVKLLKAKTRKVKWPSFGREDPDYSGVRHLMARGLKIKKPRRPPSGTSKGRQSLASAARGWQLDAPRFSRDLTGVLKERGASYSGAAREMGLTEATVRRYASGRGISAAGVRVPALVVLAEWMGKSLALYVSRAGSPLRAL